MGYSNYKKIKQVRDYLKVKIASADLFDSLAIPPIAPSEWLLISLKRAYSTPPNNEKAKSERLVSPVLLEVLNSFETKIAFFSGEEVNVNAEDNLSGPCDFFFALAPPSLVLEAPIISIAEAKDEDLEWGLAQCAAQVYGAHLYNKAEGKEIPTLYGCATTGVDWHFFKFENNTFYIDKKPMTDLPQVLGIWHWILSSYVNDL